MKSSKDSGEAVELSKTIFFPADIAQASPGVPPVIFNMPNFFVKEQFYADFFTKKWNSSRFL